MKHLLIAILLLGAVSAQYFSQEEVEASFENDLKDLDDLTKDMHFDEDFDFLEDAQDEEDPFDFEDDLDDEFDTQELEPESDFLEDGEVFDDAELGDSLEEDEDEPSSYVRIPF